MIKTVYIKILNIPYQKHKKLLNSYKLKLRKEDITKMYYLQKIQCQMLSLWKFVELTEIS